MLYLLIPLCLAAPLLPEEAVTAALARSPEVLRAEAVLAGSRGAVRDAVPFVENPRVEAELDPDGEHISAVVAQPLSLSGEGLAEARAARHAREAAEARLLRTRLMVAADARVAWINAVSTREQATLATDALSQASRVREVAETRVAAGDAPLLEVRLARVGEALAVRDLLLARREEMEAVLELSVLVGLRPEQVELPPDPSLAAPEARQATAERTDLRAARADAEAARARLARERAAAFPRLDVGVFYEADGAGAASGPAFGLEIPLWSHNRATVGLARGELAGAEAELRATELRGVSEREASAGALSEAEGAMARVRADLGVDIQAALDGVTVAYQVGDLDATQAALLRTELIEGRVALVEARAELARLRIFHLLASEDDALLGGAPTATQNQLQNPPQEAR